MSDHQRLNDASAAALLQLSHRVRKTHTPKHADPQSDHPPIDSAEMLDASTVGEDNENFIAPVRHAAQTCA